MIRGLQWDWSESVHAEMIYIKDANQYYKTDAARSAAIGRVIADIDAITASVEANPAGVIPPTAGGPRRDLPDECCSCGHEERCHIPYRDPHRLGHDPGQNGPGYVCHCREFVPMPG